MSCKKIIILLCLSFVAYSYSFCKESAASKIFNTISVNDINDTSLTGWKIIDVRKEEEFVKGHIPGAINIWRTDIENRSYPYGGMMSPRDSIANLLSKLGVEAKDRIVVYDAKGNPDALRFWWILRIYGHHNVVVLDGGYKAWLNSKRKISAALVHFEQSNYVFEIEEDRKHFATIQDVQNAIKDSNTIIIDTRSLDEYAGNIMKDGSYRAGRIPTSINIDWSENIHYKGDEKFKSYNDLIALYREKGVTRNKHVIIYCHSGVRSAHTTFVLTQLLGYNSVKNYDGSWVEWSYNKELPIDSGEILFTMNKDFVPETSYWYLFLDSFYGYANYVWSEITFQSSPWYQNYFWWLILLSLLVWLLEILFPWRKNQPIIRADFWIDAFYMFFNFFIFNLVIFIAFCNLTAQLFTDLLGGDLSDLAIINIQNYPEWLQLLVFFLATDFIQWITHVMLHRFAFLWRFHKVHHSVEQMGFAAHLRYHWMENVFYKPMKYIMVMLIGGFHPEQAFIVYYVAIVIGHLNHANIGWSYGPLKYILNNPKMHIWHHSYEMLEEKPYGSNFGISLSIWDYIFRTNYIPHSGRDIKLGFDKIENYPKSFFSHLFIGFLKKK